LSYSTPPNRRSRGTGRPRQGRAVYVRTRSESTKANASCAFFFTLKILSCRRRNPTIHRPPPQLHADATGLASWFVRRWRRSRPIAAERGIMRARA
jgi:hypothetical protein